MTNVFISWSGQQSKEIAEELRSWIPSVLQFAKPYFTPNDIEKGAKWSSEITKKLADCNVGIVCLTKENFNKPWILFEAGALAKDLEKSKVCSILFGMENTDLTGPLTTFQTTQFSKPDFKKLMHSINQSGGEQALATETFNKVFDMWWPQLEEKIRGILAKDASDDNEDLRNDRDILEEILVLTRSIARSDGGNRRVPFGLIRDLLSSIEKIALINDEKLSHEINDALGMQLRAVEYLGSRYKNIDEELGEKVDELRTKISDFIPF